MRVRKQVLVRATSYRCLHKVLGVPYWRHQAYELEIVGHGWTMAPSKDKVTEWALDWLDCTYDDRDWEVIIEWM